MQVLVACEESQEVCKAFRKIGITAFSCDVLSCSGGHPEWHIISDVVPVLDGFCAFVTQNGVIHHIQSAWDLIIGFPPCTYLTHAGNRYFSEKVTKKSVVIEREKKREDAAKLFLQIYYANCRHIAIENPVGYMNSVFRKPDQIIHPYYFGDSAQKRTCLWLKNLPKLEHSYGISSPDPVYIASSGKRISWTESKHGGFIRSKTFPGIASAMATQWSKFIEYFGG